MSIVRQITVVLLCILFGVGCATKRYVRNQVTPVINRVNELDTQTAQNSKEINSVDARLQQDIQSLNASSEQLVLQVRDADSQAERAQQLATTADARTSSLLSAVNNLDNYHVVAHTSVKFGFDDVRLTPDAKQELDQMAGQLSSAKNCIVVVEGRTDGTGNEDYNNRLSERRALEVGRYLVAKYDLKPYKIRVIGLGTGKPVASNTEVNGRKQNRSAEIAVFSDSSLEPSQGASEEDESYGRELGQAAPQDR